MSWHILDTGSIWLKEFASALSSIVPTKSWCPEIRNFGHWEDWERSERIKDPCLEVFRFPLQRGYHRLPIRKLFPFEEAVTNRLSRSACDPIATLVCTAPHYAPVAELWPGRVIYYLTDLTKEYAGVNAKNIISLDRRMCEVAAAVCPNSLRIAEYLCGEAGCDREKVTIIPNATRAQNVLPWPLRAPIAPPSGLADLPRPIVGIIGNLAANMDWVMIADAVGKAQDVSWAFIGPTHMGIPDAAQESARRDLMRRRGRIRFVGSKPYGELCHYARCFDVALMPYKKQEPTWSGSATRYYEHLAACRPMLASRGFHELLSKEPLLTLVDDGEDIAAAIDALRSNGFVDGFEELRWLASREGTWLVRARDLVAAAIGSHEAAAARSCSAC